MTDGTGTLSKQPFHDRAVSALKRARTIWSRTANASKESAHATKVLETILIKVSSSTQASTPKPHENRRSPAAAAAGLNPSSAPSDQPDTPSSSWSAVNSKAPRATSVVRRGFSVAWDFGVDTFHTERNRDLDDPIDLAVNGDMDWVRIAPPTHPSAHARQRCELMSLCLERNRLIPPRPGACQTHAGHHITCFSTRRRQPQGRMALYRTRRQES